MIFVIEHDTEKNRKPTHPTGWSLQLGFFTKYIPYCAGEYKGSVTDQMNPNAVTSGDLSVSIYGLLQE
jgi:hypothetical protein